MRRADAESLALGLLQGPAELVPVSSSGHVAAVPWLLRWEVAGWDGARRKELEVALHAGAGAALLILLRPKRVRPALLAAAVLPPAVVGFVLERRIEERLGTPATLAAGLLAGAGALVLADRAETTRRAAAAGFRDGLALGCAQTAALMPGVSRNGATLAAARALGHSRAEASALSFGVAGPVLIGATALKAWRGRRTADRELVAAGVAASFVGTRAALRVFGLERGPLWPFAVERVVLAAAVRYRRRA